VLGGGNLKKLKTLPPLCRPGDNANAFVGGYRLWEETGRRAPEPPAPRPARAERKVSTSRPDGAGG
jgi:polyphosphate glucokinase